MLSNEARRKDIADMHANKEKLINISREILILSRNTLLVNLRFLDMALSQFELLPIDTDTILTDGKYILYNPYHVLKNYKAARETIVRDYLHMVMHCVFRHMYMDASLDRIYWDLACDISVENVITELKLKAVTSVREYQQEQYLAFIKQEIKHVTAENVYSYLRQTVTDLDKIDEIRTLFYADNHEIWYMTLDEIGEQFWGTLGQEKRQTDSTRQVNDVCRVKVRSDMEEVWHNIARRMQVDMETFGKKRGRISNSMTQNLAAVNREKYDYTSFLKKFAVMGEVMKINDDEFDNIFYTYGLKLYEKMPLVEPLEYKEVKAIREFVIAIDTSGSTSGELVQKFVQKTYNVLKSSESFFTKINVHIIQCDADIQEDRKITCQGEFDEYLKTMQIRGLGGTDFRPVFTYVEQLRKNKEFINLKGLIYFTDGFGEYPVQKPDYKTAFVFLDEEYNDPEVPSWAIKLMLQKNELI